MKYKEWCQNAGKAYAILCKYGLHFAGINPETVLTHKITKTKLFQNWLRQNYLTRNRKITEKEKEIVVSVVTADISDFPTKIDNDGRIQIFCGFWKKDLKIKKQKRKAGDCSPA